MPLYERFYLYMKARNLSQSDLSYAAHVPQTSISRFLRGQSTGVHILEKIVSACPDLSLGWLFHGVGNMLRSGEVVPEIEPLPTKGSQKLEGLYRVISKRDEVIASNYDLIREKDELIQKLLLKKSTGIE